MLLTDWTRRGIPAAAAPLLLLLISIGFYWKLALTDHYTWFDHPDMAYIEVPRLQFQAREIHAGRFPLWDPHLWAGQPLIGQTQPGPLYPLNLLLYVLPLRDGYLRVESLNWYFVVVHFLAALFCYWLCRDLGRSRAASLVAGCAFSFGGFLGTVAWLDVMNGAVWTPLVFLFLLRAVRGVRPAASAALAGMFLGIAWLCGHHEIPLLVSYTALATWLFYVVREGRPNWNQARLAALFLLVTGMTSAVQTWPTYEFGRRSYRWVGTDQPVAWNDTIPYTVPTVYSLPARGLLHSILPGQNQYADSSPFLGVVAVSLAALGVIMSWSDPRARWLLAVGTGGVVYSLGYLTPFHGVLYTLAPMLGRARIPLRAIHLFNFSIAVLAAYGMDSMSTEPESRWTRRLALALAGFGGLILASAAVQESGIDRRILVTGLAAWLLAAMPASRRWLNRQISMTCVLGLVLLELSGAGPSGFSNRYDQTRNHFVNVLYQNRDIADFLRSQPGPLRVAINDQDIPTNFGDWHGVDMLQGYVAGVSSNMMRHELHTRRTQSLFGVTHWVGRNPDRPDQEPIFEGSSGIKVFRNPDPLPRAWAVHEAVGVTADPYIRISIQDAAFDLRRKTVLLGDVPALETCSGQDEVRILSRQSDRIALSARLPCRGMVVLSETFFPGWKAKIDGKAARVYEAYGALRGVVVEGGAHTIELRYQPLSVYGGAFLTALALSSAAALALRARAEKATGAAL